MWVKICGITCPDFVEQLLTGRHLPDAIGLNFYAKSKRCVSVESAAEIVRRLPASVVPIGLFVNHSLQQIRDITGECGLTTIQLHGDETPEFLAQLTEFRLIRAFRVGEDGLQKVGQALDEYRRLGITLERCLVDSQVAGTYGGTGHTAPWTLLRDEWKADWPRLTLAGGLTPENVAEAIAVVRPDGVDVASGVEAAAGVQSLEKVMSFLAAARATPVSTGS